jgi:hypothetical protein
MTACGGDRELGDPVRPTGYAALLSLKSAGRMTAMGHIAVIQFASVSGS